MSPPDLIGEILGNYRIEARLGSGGMGQVYLARHLHLDRVAAVKVLHAHLAVDESFRARFQQEAQAVASLDHPNIVRLLDFGVQEGRLYLVMELLTDGSLRSLLRDRDRPGSDWTLATGIGLVRQAAAGLAYAHGRGMVHRDIKPDNLLLKLDDDAVPRSYTGKLADFGLARLAEGGVMTASGLTLGTPAYMSPEQCQNRELDYRSDIYSLGIVLYEVLTSRVPFKTRSLSDAIYNHVYVAPPSPRSLRPELSPDLEAIVLRCLAKHPDDRYQSIAALMTDLAGIVSDGPDALLRTEASSSAPATPDVVNVNPAPSLASGPSGAQIPRVYVLDADGAVVEIADLTGAGLTVGRLPGNQLIVDAEGVSRHHLVIDWDGSSARVTDLGSSQGTTLGGTPIPAHLPQPWDPRQVVRIGARHLRLALPEPSPVVTRVNDPDAATVEREPRAVVAPGADARRWPLMAVVGVVAVLVAALAFTLLLSGDGDDDDDPAAGTTADTPTLAAGSEMATSAPTPAAVATAPEVDLAEVTPFILPTAPANPETPADWIALAVAHPSVAALLGPPFGELVTTRAQYLEFERGLMIAGDDDLGGGMIVAVEGVDYDQGGTFTVVETAGFAGVVLATPDPGPPVDLFAPVAPFDAIWQGEPDLREALGWAFWERPGDILTYRRFERGAVFHLDGSYQSWIFYGDLATGSAGDWESFYNELTDLAQSSVDEINAMATIIAIDEVSRQLGAPLTEPAPAEMRYQLFETGLLFSGDFLAAEEPAAAGAVIALFPTISADVGEWRAYPLAELLPAVEAAPVGTPPAERYYPAPPFDIVLASNPDLSAAVGWALFDGIGTLGAWQRFEHGYTLAFSGTSRTWVLLVGGDNTVNGQWQWFWN